MLYTPAFAWVSAGENAKPQNFLCLLLLGTEVKKKKKDTTMSLNSLLLLTQKPSVMSSRVKNYRKALNIVHGIG